MGHKLRMSNLKQVSSLYRNYLKKITIALIAIAVACLAWANMIFNVNNNANAATLVNLPIAVTAEGISDLVKGNVDEAAGTVQRNLGDATDNSTEEIKGALKQAKGKAEKSLGTAKNKLDNAENDVENASEGFIESVKDLFD